MMIIAVAAMLLGVALPLLTILKLLPSTLCLNFLAVGASMGGLLLGMTGLALYFREHRKPRE